MTPLRPKSPESFLTPGDNPLDAPIGSEAPRPSILPKVISILFPAILLLLAAIFFGARLWARHTMQASLPQLDGSISIPGLSAPVTIQRDTHSMPHIHAASLDDLILAQGYVTAQDRLWQMETLRRHASGELAEILGASLVHHDRVQRNLQLRTAAERAITALPPDQLHWLELYAKGVNASIATQRDHLPIEFRVLQFTPAPWTPRDSLLVYLVMFQDLTNRFPDKLAREAISARIPPDLLADLYPVGSWRDHPPSQPQTDLTDPNVELPDIPLDESQTKLIRPKLTIPKSTITLQALQQLRQSLASLNLAPACEGCLAGSNNWAVSGAHTASGKPLLSNDMHLTHGIPGIWYETDLQSPTPTGTPFHVTGVALPGTPFIVVGHNDHIAWGFTNLGADVQDLLVERIRVTPTGSEFQAADGNWHPLLHQREIIHVRRDKDIVLDVASTQHDGITSPILTGVQGAGDSRRISLRWTIYDPVNLTDPFLAINSATDWTSLCAAFSTWGGPAQNLVYADDQGHIAYHAIGRIPIRGSLLDPAPPSPVPVGALDPGSQWSGYIPFDQLPQALDPPSGVLATANSRITPDNYPFVITLDWSDPYRNERIWKTLIPSQHLTPADMLRLQTDVYSDLDHVIAQRLAYAIDHSDSNKSPTTDDRRLHAAADILRNWNGNVDSDAVAPSIVAATRAVFWSMLLSPKLGNGWQLYTWGEMNYAAEQIIMHAPARWLPKPYTSWDNFLAAAVENGLIKANAPTSLAKWQYGPLHPVDIENPLFNLSPLIPAIIGIPTGTGAQPQSGDSTTVKQVRRDFGPSERFTADLSDLDHSTLNIVLGQSGNPTSHWFMDQWPAWYHGATFALPYSTTAVNQATTHTLTLTPQ